MAYWEPPGEDPYELHVAEAEVYLDMTDDDVVALAAEFGITVAEYEQRRHDMIARYRQVNEDDLTPDQYRRLFGTEPDLGPFPGDDELAAELGLTRGQYDELMAKAKKLGIGFDQDRR